MLFQETNKHASALHIVHRAGCFEKHQCQEECFAKQLSSSGIDGSWIHNVPYSYRGALRRLTPHPPQLTKSARSYQQNRVRLRSWYEVIVVAMEQDAVEFLIFPETALSRS